MGVFQGSGSSETVDQAVEGLRQVEGIEGSRVKSCIVCCSEQNGGSLSTCRHESERELLKVQITNPGNIYR